MWAYTCLKKAMESITKKPVSFLVSVDGLETSHYWMLTTAKRGHVPNVMFGRASSLFDIFNDLSTPFQSTGIAHTNVSNKIIHWCTFGFEPTTLESEGGLQLDRCSLILTYLQWIKNKITKVSFPHLCPKKRFVLCIGVCCRVITCREEVRYTPVMLQDKQPDTVLRVAWGAGAVGSLVDGWEVREYLS